MTGTAIEEQEKRARAEIEALESGLRLGRLEGITVGAGETTGSDQAH